MIAGILRGSGRQAIASLVNFVAYYIFGLPLAIVLALVVDLGTFGLWTGLLVGDSLQVSNMQGIWCFQLHFEVCCCSPVCTSTLHIST